MSRTRKYDPELYRLVRRDATPAREDYRIEAFKRMDAAIVAEAAAHTPGAGMDRPGNGGFPARRLFCSVCRTEWPCRFLIWAHKACGGTDMTPLTSSEYVRNRIAEAFPASSPASRKHADNETEG